MLSKDSLKRGDTFFYVIPHYYGEMDDGHLSFITAEYSFNPKEKKYYSEDRMFLTKAEAEQKAAQLQEEEGY